MSEGTQGRRRGQPPQTDGRGLWVSAPRLERCIEEVLFNESIQRFGEGVSTLRLKRVVVTDDDYRKIDAGMTKSSKFEHDAAMRVGRLPVPDPDELSGDIERLDTWRKAVILRREQVAAARP